MKYFFIGLISGLSLMFLFKTYFVSDFRYVQTKKDYRIEDIGIVKKGTALRIDKSMPEGFSRYILYLNLKDNDVEPYKVNHKLEVIPYWLYKIDSIR